MPEKYGSLLRKAFEAIQSGGLAVSDADILERAFNEFDDLANIYKSWKLTGSEKIDSQKIDLPIGLIYANKFSVDTSSVLIPIPSIYNHLLFMGQIRNTETATTLRNFAAQVNGDTGSNYARQNLTGLVTTAAASAVNPGDYLGLGIAAGGSNAAGKNCSFYAFMTDISGSLFKSCMAVGISALAGDNQVRFAGSVWANVDPVKSLLLYVADGFDIAAGSRLTCLGIM